VRAGSFCKDAVKSPVLKEIEESNPELNLAPVVEADRAHPKSWWVISGRVLWIRKLLNP
jgi:signal recognition particle subunit SRP19